MAAVGELVRSTSGQWMVRLPQRCAQGHRLWPGHVLVGTIACSCGRHLTLVLRMPGGHVRPGAGRAVQPAQRARRIGLHRNAVEVNGKFAVVQRMLGHASAAMTLDVYADLFDSDLDAVAENVAKMWPRRANSQRCSTPKPHLPADTG